MYHDVVPVTQQPSYEQLRQEIESVRGLVKFYESSLGPDLFDITIQCLDNVLDVSFATLLKPRGIVYAEQCMYLLSGIRQWVNSSSNPQYKEFIQACVEALKQASHLK